jgi:hypothetical protein
MSFSIKLRPSAMEKRHLVVGPIWLEIDGKDFPGEGWDDFPVVILGWWLSEVKPLLTNQTGSCECLFMDGPYEFEVNVLGKELWGFTLIKRGLDDKGEDVKVCLMEKQTAPKIFISELISAANMLVNLCRQNGWESDDLITLENKSAEVGELAQTLSLI